MKILLLAGGNSSEREVSLATGRAVYDSLKRQQHTVFAIDPLTGKSLISRDGKFLAAPRDDSSRTAVPVKSETRALINAISSPGFRDIDVVFVALHGGTGENGSCQCLLEMAGQRFTGAGMTASAIAMNKAVAKRLFQSVDIPTPDWALYRLADREVDTPLLDEIAARFDCPFIVKPNDSGSTVGLTKVNTIDELKPAIARALDESDDVLVEKYIRGREMTVAVLDGEALPVVEIIPASGLYDYEAKYTKGKCEYVTPAPIDSELAGRLSEAALRAYDVIGAAGLARVDFILDENENFYCLELNTLPGMTELSLSPMAAAAAGIGFDQLVDRIVKSAVKGRQR
ncbi:MAG: D-alanine--D-alanine ligase [candidate division Zixibacteria bacterium]|nr:D-alanine--D-alanine ligase [candidate division Zixibacteria bacterium]